MRDTNHKRKNYAAENVITQLNLIDEVHRVFDTSMKDAQLYGIVPELFGELILIGLSHETRADGTYFDSDDLYNVSLYLGLPSVHKMAMRSWAKAFRSAQQEQTLTLSYGVSDTEELPEECRVLSSQDGYIIIHPTDSSAVFQETVSLRPPNVRLPQKISELLRSLVAGFEFYMLHDAIRWDILFMEKYRIGECGGFSKLIASEARSLGYLARQVFGILASPPFGTGHYWAEIQVEGEWIKIDPLMIQLLIKQKLLKPDEYPIDFSPSGALVTLAVIDNYNCIGAPLLKCQTETVRRFIKQPIILSDNKGLPVSISVTLEAR